MRKNHSKIVWIKLVHLPYLIIFHFIFTFDDFKFHVYTPFVLYFILYNQYNLHLNIF